MNFMQFFAGWFLPNHKKLLFFQPPTLLHETRLLIHHHFGGRTPPTHHGRCAPWWEHLESPSLPTKVFTKTSAKTAPITGTSTTIQNEQNTHIDRSMGRDWYIDLHLLDFFGIQYVDPMAFQITTSNGLVLTHHPSLHVVSLRLRGTHSVSGSHDHLLDRARDVVGPGTTLHVYNKYVCLYWYTNTFSKLYECIRTCIIHEYDITVREICFVRVILITSHIQCFFGSIHGMCVLWCSFSVHLHLTYPAYLYYTLKD